MKKLNGLVLSTLTAALLVGCGGGSSDSSTGGTTATPTDVTVERGAIWGATVTDANGQKAIQQSETSNVYRFASAPAYPIKSVGGIIDIDGDSSTTDDVVDFTGKELISYSTVITPITNYLGDTSKGKDGEAKLEALKKLLKITSNDDLLKKVPSATNKEILALTNALFEVENDSDDSNDDSFEDRFTELKGKFVDGTELKDFAKLLEDEVVSTTGFTKLTEDERNEKIEKITASIEVEKSTLTWESLPSQFNNTVDTFAELVALYTTTSWYVGEVVLNANGKVYDKETGLVEKGTWTTSSIETINIKLNDGQKIYLRVTKIGENYVIQNTPYDFEDSTSTPTDSTTFVLTNSMISGKEIYIDDADGTATLQFKADGTYSEVWDDTKSDGDKGTCDGNWTLGTNSVTVVGTCSDNSSDNTTLTFNQEPKDGSKFSYFDNMSKEGGEVTISSIKNISQE